MPRFAKGFRQTEFGKRYQYPSHLYLLEKDTEVELVSSDLTIYRTDEIRQCDQGSCVTEFLRRAVQQYHKIRNVYTFDISDQAAYTFARLQEFAGLELDQPPELRDDGTDPVYALQASQNVGLVLARDWPGPGDPGHVYTNRNKEPPEKLILGAWESRFLQFHQVVWEKGKLQETLDLLHRRGFPTGGALCADGIDAADPRGSIVTSLPPARFANHMVSFLDSSNTGWARLDNWWNDPHNPNGAYRFTWGDRSTDPHYTGTWRCSWEALESGLMAVYAIDFAPFLEGVA